jgi:hypothetical protein
MIHAALLRYATDKTGALACNRAPLLVIAREAKPTVAIQLELQMDCFVAALLA